MKNFKIFALILVVLLLLLGFFTFNSKKQKIVKKPLVAVSTFALYDITKHIAPKSVKIVNILPFGADPHDFESTPKLMEKIEKSSLVFVSGAGLEPWVDKIQFTSKVIDVSKYVKLRELGSKKSNTQNDVAHSRIDPHYWLNFSNMKKATNVITNALIKLLPQNREVYTQNRDKYLQMLDKLDKAYSQKLQSCHMKEIIVNHNAEGYLADRYHFHVESLSGLTTEVEPTPKDIQRVFQDIKRERVPTLFFENFINNKTIKMIGHDTNVHVEVFQSLGNITADEEKVGITYEKAMYANLKKLSKALMCN